MAFKNTNEQFGSIAKFLHWVIAASLLTIIFLGLEQAEMPRGDGRTFLRLVHASLATVVLLLMTARILWRFISPPPGHPSGMPAWQRISSSLVHWGLYATVFTQLLAGAMIEGTAGRGLPMFGFFTIPLPIEENRDSHEWWEEIHEFMWQPLAVLMGIHVLAALYNHFIVKNDVLRRMTIGSK